jgi:hypothetical protein
MYDGTPMVASCKLFFAHARRNDDRTNSIMVFINSAIYLLGKKIKHSSKSMRTHGKCVPHCHIPSREDLPFAVAAMQ